MREREFGKEARDPPVDHAMPLATGLLSQGAAEKRLTDPGGPGDEDVLMLGDPAAARELPHEGAVQFPATVIEIFETGVAHTEFGLFEPPRQRAILASELFGIDEDAEALVE